MITLKHHQSANGVGCLPACALMIAAGLGIEKSEEYWANLLGTEERGSHWWGLPVLEHYLPISVQMGKGATFRLTDCLSRGVAPILALTALGKPHAVVLVGKLNGDALVHDPAQSAGPTRLPWELLIENWTQTGRFFATIEIRQSGVDEIAFIYNAAGNPVEVYSLSPERQTNFGSIEKVDGILLSGNTIALAQPECNTLSGLFRAWRNIRIPSLRISSFNYRVPECSTLDFFAVELDPADTIRGYNWPGKEFLCTGVSLHFDHEKGIILADIDGEESTWGPDGVAGPYPPGLPSEDPPDEPPEYWDDWANGVGSDPPPWADDITEYVAYFVTGIFYGGGGGVSSGHVIRATNARSPIPGAVVYTDLGLVDADGLRWIALDEFDPVHKAMCCGPLGVWSTVNLNAAVPVWTLEIALPPGYDPQCGFTMVRSSPVQDGVWMAVCWTWGPGGEVRVYWTINDGLAWNDREISWVDCGEWPLNDFPYLELSSHDVNKAWVSFDRWNDGLPHVVRTSDMWTSAGCYEPIFDCLVSTQYGYEQYAPMHHRYASNPTDQVAIMGGRHYPDRATRVIYTVGDLGDPGAACTDLCTVVGTGVGHGVREVGCFKTATDKWWALVWCFNVVRFMTVVGGAWVTQYSWPRAIATNPMMLHAAGCRENADWFYLTEDGDGAVYGPLWVSFDGGASWQRQTGNWNTLCVANGWTGGDAPIIHCVAPVWTPQP